jgi:hypothetical protein
MVTASGSRSCVTNEDVYKRHYWRIGSLSLGHIQADMATLLESIDDRNNI